MSRHPFATIQARASSPYRSRGSGGVRSIDSQLLRDQLAEVVAPLDGLDLIHVQGAADDEPHLAAVGDQPLDAPGRQDQGIGREVAGRPVVLGGARQGRDVEQADEVPVLVAVAGLPGVAGNRGCRRVTATPLAEVIGLSSPTRIRPNRTVGSGSKPDLSPA